MNSGSRLVLACACILATSAQGQVTFQRTLNDTTTDHAVWAAPTPDDDGFVVLGARDVAAAPSRVMKLDHGGGIEWAREYDPPGEPSHIIATESGGYAFTGGNELVRLGSDGSVAWARTFGAASGGSFFAGPSVDEYAFGAGGLVMAGRSGSFPALRRFGPGGGIWFANALRNTSVADPVFNPNPQGGFNDVQTTDDGFVAVGWLNVPPSPGAGGIQQTLVVRFDLAGNIIWARTYRQQLYNVAYGVDLAANGDYLICGFTKDVAEGGGVYLMRLTPGGLPSGEFASCQEWYAGFQGTRSIEELPNGDILLGGSTPGTWPVHFTGTLITNSAGAFKSARRYGGTNFTTDFGRCALPTADGGVMVLGEAASFTNSVGRDFYLIKQDAPEIGTSGCWEEDVVFESVPALCDIHIEEFVLEPESPDTLDVRVTEPVLGNALHCMDCPGNDVCLPGAVLEGETIEDSPGGPCDPAPVNAMPISCGTTVCGDFWWDTVTPGIRDTDWYEFTIAGAPRSVEITVHADVDVDLHIMSAACPYPTQFYASGAGTCPTRATIDCLFDGTYWIFVSPKFSNQPIAIPSAESKYTLTLSCSSCTFPDWSDGFDNYGAGTLVPNGQWEAWDGDTAFGNAQVIEAPALSQPHSVAIDLDDDVVRQFGYESGRWQFSTWQYVPGDFSGESFLILLNNYDPTGPDNWSVQLGADSAANVIRDINTGDTLPLVRDQWIEIVVDIDLDADTVSVHYDGTLLVTKNWQDGAGGVGPPLPAIGAVDLFANGASPVYYDTMSLVVVETCATDLDGDGQIGFGDLLTILSSWGTCEGCPADLNGDGNVGFADLLEVLAAWGAC